MASEVHLVLTVDGRSGPVPGGTTALARMAEDELGRLERLWSRFLPDSDVTRLNRSEGEAVEVHPDTVTLLATMVEAARVTAGRYDPTLLPALVALGYGVSRTDPRLVTELPPAAVSGGCLPDVVIDVAAGTVAVPREVALDPGGIGKGLAADLVVDRLCRAGATGASLAVGGDVAMAGQAPLGAGWRVAVEHPDADRGPVAVVVVDRGGVATSSTRSRRWHHAGRAVHHVLDPRTGEPAVTDLAAVTVFASRGWLAEAHATSALLAGRAGVLEHLRAHGLSGVAVALDGEPVATADLQGILVGAGR